MIPISVGLNHHATPFELREKTAIGEERIPDALVALRRYAGLEEAVIIATCNRLEIFSVCHAEQQEKICDWICDYCAIDSQELADLWYKRQEDQAVRHLIRIACGLDSAVIGEPQILGQVKTAYQLAQQHQHTGTVLNKIFEHCISVAKQIRSQTDLGKHPISYASVILDRLKLLFDDLPHKQVLVIGVGEMNQLVIKHFQDHGIKSIAVANRTEENAILLAQEHQLEVVDFDDLTDGLHRYDIIVSCTASPSHILDCAVLEKALTERARKPMHVSDLALPRDVDPRVNDIKDIYLHSLKELEKIIGKNHKLRQQAGDEAEAIIAQGVDTFQRWLNARQALPLLQLYREHAQQQAERALHNALQQLNNGENTEEVLRKLTHTLGQQLMHPMTETITNSASTGDKNLLRCIEQTLKKNKAS